MKKDSSLNKGPSAFITEAYNLEDKDSILSFYRKWAQDYDEQMQSQGYTSPQDIASLLAGHLTNLDSELLDIGCGTGLTGKSAADLGFTTIDGMDISGEMIAVARSRGIYRKLFVADLHQPLTLESNSYDAAISSGTFTHGHVGPEPLAEITRLLRPGGLLACTVHFDLWHSRGFDAMFAELMGSKQLRCAALAEGPYFSGAKNEGWFCVYQKLPTEDQA